MEARLVSDEREFLERSLADLELERAAGDLSDADYADLKARYERKRAALQPGSGDATTPDVASPRRQNGGRGWGKSVVTVAVVAVIAVGAGIGVATSSGSRRPGEQVSGKVITTHDQQMTQAAEKFQQGDASGAVAIYRSLLEENPKDVAALTYLGWTLRNVALQQDDQRLTDAAVGFIEQATQIDPDYAEAWFFRGIIYLRDEDEPDKAEDALKLALANDPIAEIETAARELLAEIAQG
jgi:tetratricopeptide (TPR) repeat protein